MGAPSSAALAVFEAAPVRRRERRPVSLRAFAIRPDGSTVEVLLLDLSYEGCGITTPVPLRRGEPVKLSVLRRGAIQGCVRWCKDGKAGLVFQAQQPFQKQHWPRRFDRKSVEAEIFMRRLGKLNYRVRVFDFSPSGCRVDLAERPRVGEHVLVKFQGLETLQAEVCWVEGSCAGLRFEKEIHPAVFDLLLDRLK